jgi:hypothetical protein
MELFQMMKAAQFIRELKTRILYSRKQGHSRKDEYLGHHHMVGMSERHRQWP